LTRRADGSLLSIRLKGAGIGAQPLPPGCTPVPRTNIRHCLSRIR
jgi:hypothetical protein